MDPTEVHRKQWVSTETLNKFFKTDPSLEEQPTTETIPTVMKTKPNLQPEEEQEPKPTIDLSTEDSKMKIAQAPAAQPSDTQKPSQPPANPFQADTSSQEANTFSDSSNKRLEDIFLAETKYDIFVDIAKKPAQNKAQASANKDNGTSNDKIDTPTNLPPIAPNAPEQAAFNVFDQKMKDQTSLIDVEDVSNITKHMTEKDLSFVKHAKPNENYSKTSTTSRASDQQEEVEEVMDPFEQLLNGTLSFQELPPEQENTEAAEEESISAPAVETEPTATEAIEPTVQTPEMPLPPEPEKPVLQTKIKLSKKQATRVIPIPPIDTEKTMNEHEEGQKTFIHLKRKANAAPQPPKPAAPQPPAPLPPAPQEEKHRTILRKRKPSKTFMESTTTIDHSIELPLSELKKHNWPLEVPLIPTYTLENMTISINRFAHATAISVIENPGRLYNPLVLHGSSGTGKTHFLHAIGYALSKKYGQENIFITNGVRLSRGIQRYIMEGNIAKFEEFTSSVKALLIDDIHLISVNEQNRSHLSKLLNDFLAQKKQIVITSKYPPENLAKLEELLNFKLDSGWISDLKQAHGPARMRIIQNMLGSNGINITNEDVNRFFGHANMSLGTVVRSIRRVRVLEKLMSQSTTDVNKLSPIVIFDQLLATKGEDQKSLIAQKAIDEIQSASVLGNGEWGRIGFFYPQNNANMMNWLLFALQQRAKELGIPGGPELAVRSSYSTENIISSAFKIANLCDNKKLKGAVILGPSMNVCEPSVRENFYDILTHMLEIMLIRCGVINFEDAAAPSTYVKILSELLR